MKATEEYFPVVLFIMLYEVVLTLKFVGEILTSDHSNESFWQYFSVVLRAHWFRSNDPYTVQTSESVNESQLIQGVYAISLKTRDIQQYLSWGATS